MASWKAFWLNGWGTDPRSGDASVTAATAVTATGAKNTTGVAVTSVAVNTTTTGITERFGVAVVTATSSTSGTPISPETPSSTGGGFWRGFFARRPDKAKPQPEKARPKHASGDAYVLVRSSVTAEGYVRYPRPKPPAPPRKRWLFGKPQPKQPVTLSGAATLMPLSRVQLRIREEDELLLMDVL